MGVSGDRQAVASVRFGLGRRGDHRADQSDCSGKPSQERAEL